MVDEGSATKELAVLRPCLVGVEGGLSSAVKNGFTISAAFRDLQLGDTGLPGSFSAAAWSSPLCGEGIAGRASISDGSAFSCRVMSLLGGEGEADVCRLLMEQGSWLSFGSAPTGSFCGRSEAATRRETFFHLSPSVPEEARGKELAVASRPIINRRPLFA